MIVECKECEAIVDAIELKEYECPASPEDPPVRFCLSKCPRCSNPLFTVQDYFYWDDEHQGWNEATRLYPPKNDSLSGRFPPSIRSAFHESLACLKAKAYTAAAIMCRKVLEGVCSEHGCSNKSLALDLKEMKDKGIIESRLFEWADALRIAGNEAAHGVGTTFNKQDSTDVVEFTRALLEYVFTFRDRFEEFKKRRLKVAAPAKPTQTLL